MRLISWQKCHCRLYRKQRPSPKEVRKRPSQATHLTLWQRRWDLIEVGRVFYKYFFLIAIKRPFDQPPKESYSWILQLWTSCSTLSDSRSKLGQDFESSLCMCRQVGHRTFIVAVFTPRNTTLHLGEDSNLACST